MPEAIVSILVGLALLVPVGVCLLGYVVWQKARRSEDGHDAG